MNTSIDSKSTMESGSGNAEIQKTNNAENPTNPKQVAGHSDDDSGCALEEYTWVPPGLKPDQVGNKRDGCLSLFNLMLIFWA